MVQTGRRERERERERKRKRERERERGTPRERERRREARILDEAAVTPGGDPSPCLSATGQRVSNH